MTLLVTIAALVLLLAGVVGTLLPGVPSSLFSLGGVYLYWWASGFAEPGTLLLVTLTLLGLLALAADWAGGVVSARIGGASLKTSLIAGIVGIVLFVFVTPVGALLGIVITVFALEARRHGDAIRGGKTAAVVALGMLGSTVAQVLLTAAMLGAFLVGVLL